MIWGECHWIGLCISLPEWSIFVLDPNSGLKSMEEVEVLMEPLAAMLPYISKKVWSAGEIVDNLMVPFNVARLGGLNENVSIGDCRPVAVKFLEMHAAGDLNPTMAGLTDDLLDIFRKHYAMDIYKELVFPVYFP